MQIPKRSVAAVLVTSLSIISVAWNAASDESATSVERAAHDDLTGREIYEKFLENKYRESFQRLRIISRDPGGSEQVTRFQVSLQDFRDPENKPVEGVNAKMLVEVSAPFDMRHTSYLIVSKDPGPDDEFVYQPSARRVRRVDLKNASLFGTDYTFNDITFQNLDDADYTRLPDAEIDSNVVYVVEAQAKESVDAEYRRTITYIEKLHHVGVRARFWDKFGVEVKEMTAPHSSIRQFENTWIATESTLENLRQQTSSSIYVEHLDTDPSFHRKIFAVSRLAQGH